MQTIPTNAGMAQVPHWGQLGLPIIDTPQTCTQTSTIPCSDTTTVHPLAPPTPANGGTQAKHAYLSVETQAIRFTMDGSTAPVASTTGHLLPAGMSLDLALSDLTAFRFVAESSGAVVHVSYLVS